jgi:hypothetical protein
VVNAVAHIDIKAPRLTKERFIAGGAAAVAVASGVVLGIRFRFHNHAPQKVARGLALHQQAADELGGDMLGGAGEEGLGECWEDLVAMEVAWGWVEAIGRNGQKAQRMLFQNSNLVNQKR